MGGENNFLLDGLLSLDQDLLSVKDSDLQPRSLVSSSISLNSKDPHDSNPKVYSDATEDTLKIN